MFRLPLYHPLSHQLGESELDGEQRAAFGAWLRKHREILNLSQEEAGRRAGVSRTQWTRWERGESGTKHVKIPSIAKAVNADLFETYRLAGFDPPKDIATGFARSKFESIFHRTRQLRPAERKQIEMLVEMVERELDRLTGTPPHTA